MPLLNLTRAQLATQASPTDAAPAPLAAAKLKSQPKKYTRAKLGADIICPIPHYDVEKASQALRGMGLYGLVVKERSKKGHEEKCGLVKGREELYRERELLRSRNTKYIAGTKQG